MYFIRDIAIKVTFRSDILKVDIRRMNTLFLLLVSSPTLRLPAVSKSGLTLTRLFQEGESVPGSTDGILLMGILIVILVVLPIVWTRRNWMR